MRWAELLVTVGFGVPAVYCAMMIIVTGYMPADLVFLTVLFNMLFLYGLYEMNRSVVKRNGVPVRPKRNLGLTVYAAYLFFLECIQLAFYVMELADRATGPFSAADVLYLSAAAGFTSACAVCAAAMTDWRRWGAIGCGVTGAALVCLALAACERGGCPEGVHAACGRCSAVRAAEPAETSAAHSACIAVKRHNACTALPRTCKAT